MPINRSQQIANIANALDTDYPGMGLGARWTAFANAHPNTPVQQLGQAFALRVGIAGLGSAVGAAASGTGSALGQAAQSGFGATGIANLGGIAAIGDFFNKLTQPNTWIRVGEVGAGILLLYLGLSATMRGTELQRQASKAKGAVKKTAGVAAMVAK